MAKGNNGHVLQHGIECALVQQLSQQGDGLQFVFTHAMAPFESFEEGKGRRDLLDAALRLAQSLPADNEPPLVQAYRESGASTTRYPNSAELMRALLGEAALAGDLVETKGTKAAALLARWRGTSVKVHHESWRKVFQEPLRPLERPWLVSMDPFTYSLKEGPKEGDFWAADWDLVGTALAALFANSQPGALSIFCYELTPRSSGLPGASLEDFIEAGAAFGKRRNVSFRLFSIPANGGNCHAGLVFARSEDVLEALVADYPALVTALRRAQRRPSEDQPSTSRLSCPVPGCTFTFKQGRGGWDAHVGSLRSHPNWHPEASDPEVRRQLFRSEYPEFFD